MRNKTLILNLLIIALLAGGGVLFYFVSPNSRLGKYFDGHANEIVVEKSDGLADGTGDIIKKVSKLIILPDNEVPTIATVSDPEKLKGQDFFLNAKTGYKVLIYTNAQKAILYDPTADIIVNVAPINLGSQKSNELQSP